MSAELSELLSGILALGRKDRIALRMPEGGYRPVPKSATAPALLIADHRSGKHPLGVYLVTGDKARIGAIDLDDHDGTFDEGRMSDLAAAACRSLSERGCRPFPVRSGGGRGIHIFVFFEELESARSVRILLNDVLSEIGLLVGSTGVARGTAEVFPKQDQVLEGGLGSLIALPFARASVPLDPTSLTPVALADYKAPKWADLLSGYLPRSEAVDEPAARADQCLPLPGDEQEAEAALRYIRADDYGTWIRVGLALKQALPERGYALWLAWSRRSPKFDGDVACRQKWDSFAPRGQVGLGTVFHLGQMAGWNGPTNPLVREMNARFGILAVGNKPIIIIKDGVRPDDEVVLLGRSSFLERLQAEPLPQNSGQSGNKGKAWMSHPLAVRYHRLDFDPGRPPGHNGTTWNLWRGFAVQPAPGSWARLKEHLFENICGGSDQNFNWMLNWFAFGVQRRSEIPGTAPVLIGPPGVGKGVLANAYGALWGPHYVAVTHQEHVTGRFNNHLVARRFVFIDEGISTNDPGVVKTRITEPTLIFEQKGVDPIKMRNTAMFMVASNNESAVTADLGDRRWMVLKVKDTRREDHVYFKNIVEELHDGGYGAMLLELQYRDINKGPAPTKVIKNAELALQIIESQKPHIKYIFRCIDLGRLPQNYIAGSNCTTIRALHGEMRRLDSSAVHLTDISLGRHLKKLFPGIETALNGTYHPVGYGERAERSTKYIFPPLPLARKQFETAIGGPVPWSNTLEEWQKDPV